MKNELLKTITASAFALTIAYTGTAFAYSKSEYLGKAAGATDLYEVSCSTNSAGATYRLMTRVRTGTASSSIRVSVVTQKGPKATSSTDTANGDNVISPVVYNIGGNGKYYVTVGKTAASTTAVPYTLFYDCQTSSSAHTGAVLTQTQNQ